MKNTTLDFHIYNIWQILKRFAGTFRRAQTLKLWGVSFKERQPRLFFLGPKRSKKSKPDILSALIFAKLCRRAIKFQTFHLIESIQSGIDWITGVLKKLKKKFNYEKLHWFRQSRRSTFFQISSNWWNFFPQKNTDF